MDKRCENCKWRSDEFTSVCVNDESDHLADFVEAGGTCDYWEEMTDAVRDWRSKTPIITDDKTISSLPGFDTAKVRIKGTAPNGGLKVYDP